jgi:hypothetical protein
LPVAPIRWSRRTESSTMSSLRVGGMISRPR